MSLRTSIAAAHLSGPRPEAGGQAVMEFRFRPEDPTFAGHFPARPVVPGVYQLEMARLAAESVLHCPLAIREVVRAKFLRPVGPTEIVRLNLKISEEDGTFRAHAGFAVGGKPAGEVQLILCRHG